MSTLREAAQQALEALEDHAKQYPHMQKGYTVDAITALRAALEQPEQEPVAWIHRKHYLLGHAENMPPADKALAQGWTPLYTHPPRREWRGLSKDESLKLWGMRSDGPSNTEITSFARAIEAALKEKNHE